MKRLLSAIIVLALCVTVTLTAFADSPANPCSPWAPHYPRPRPHWRPPAQPWTQPTTPTSSDDGLTKEQRAKCKRNREWAESIAATIRSELAQRGDWRLTVVESRGKTSNGIVKLRLHNTRTGETIPDHYLFAYNGKYVAFSWEHVDNKKIADYDCLITAAGQSESGAIIEYLNWVEFGNHSRWGGYDSGYGYDYDDYDYGYDDSGDYDTGYYEPYYYTIRKGDTLTRIANRFGTTVDALVKLNGIRDRNKIYAGDTIRIW